MITLFIIIIVFVSTVGPNLQAGNNGSETVTRTEGDMFVVDCTVTDSYPSVVTLYLVVGDGLHQNIINDPVVTFDDLYTADSGAYQCIADNGQANTTYIFNLVVSEATGKSLVLTFEISRV